MKQLPAQLLIEKFGTASEVARVLDLDKSTVSRWANPLDEKGTRGYVPRKYWRDLLNVAKQRRIKLSVHDLAGL